MGDRGSVVKGRSRSHMMIKELLWSLEFFNLNQERYINLKYECMRALKFCSLVAKIRLCQLLASLGCFTDEGRFCDVREFQYSKNSSFFPKAVNWVGARHDEASRTPIRNKLVQGIQLNHPDPLLSSSNTAPLVIELVCSTGIALSPTLTGTPEEMSRKKNALDSKYKEYSKIKFLDPAEAGLVVPRPGSLPV
ncbi:hypothetical protein BDE02_10G005700 [Populus trichocarpa]|nr:hypothetical protein BDE02_10G005700 [Populus trichocarpa]